MGNLMFNVKKFLSNKNTVTILGVLLGVFVIWFGYNYRVQQAIKPIRLPYAQVTIQPRQRIEEKMIGYTDIPPAMIKGSVIQQASLIVGKYSNYNTLIPQGSLFYKDTVVSQDNLPDSAFMNVPKNYITMNLPVTVESTYGNSIMPGNYINIYFKSLDADSKVMYGKFVENVKVLAVKDNEGRHVFENTTDARKSAYLIFAVPADINLLLRKAFYLVKDKDIKAEIVPVPNTQAYKNKVGAVKLTNQFLKEFIESQTSIVPEDDLPALEEEPTVTTPETPIVTN